MKGKREARKKEYGEEKKGNCKRGGRKLKMEGERYEKRIFFFFFFFFLLVTFRNS